MKDILTSKLWIMFAFAIFPYFIPEGNFEILLRIVWSAIFVYWTLNLGQTLHNMLSIKEQLNVNIFRYNVIYATLYFVLVPILIPDGYDINQTNYHEYGWKLWLFVPTQLLMMYSTIYSIYFISRSIAILRNQKEPYLNYILMFLTYPIGIWIIQPRIIKLIENKDTVV